MTLELLAIGGGLFVLMLSASWFVEGAAATASHAGMSSLLIGMLIVGFGTSAPEIVVSVQSALDGTPALALGNAMGSNVANIGLILGLVALLKPISVESKVLRQELPFLLLVTGLLGWMLHSGTLSRLDGLVLLGVFGAFLGWSVYASSKLRTVDALGLEVREEITKNFLPLRQALLKLSVGLMLLIISARFLVWGAVGVATGLGVSELVIGLTVVAVGTSLPELAASLVAVRKNEHEIALGNVLGSNLFNSLVVTGLAGSISPVPVSRAVIDRDLPAMLLMTLALLVFGYRRGGGGRINRFEGAALLAGYLAYLGWLTAKAIAPT